MSTARFAILPRHLPSATISVVDPAFDEHDVRAIIGGVFDINAKLNAIAVDVRLIRLLLEDGDEEEEEEDPFPG